MPMIDNNLSPLSRSSRIKLIHRLSTIRNLIAPFSNPRVAGMDADSKALEELLEIFYPQLRLSNNASSHEIQIFRQRAKQMFSSLYPTPSPTCVVQAHIFKYDNVPINMYLIQHHRIDDWKNSNKPLILYFHGGGFIFGGINIYSGLECHLSEQMNMLILHVEFDLVPENNLEDILIDAIDVYKVLLSVDPNIHKRLIGMGDSSGGMLWIHLLQWIVSNKLPVPQGVVLHSPWPSLNFNNIDYSDDAAVYLKIDMMLSFRQIAIGKNNIWTNLTEEEKRKFSPKDGSYEGFPPLFITSGSDDIFIYEINSMITNAQKANVQVTFEEAEGMMHAYPLYHLWSAKALCIQKQMRQWINERLSLSISITKKQLEDFCE
ncbi:hypothetical protein I4U23_001238 [Adineta vaga]|nr:hypothetical protein I4U23_001238 [Adineta vaga]